MGCKVLLLYISEHSGHHCASIAIERALRVIRPDIETLNINSFNYTNPILEKVINRAYMSVVKRTPEVWDYLYDNPKVVRSTQKLRDAIHRFNTGKLKTLLDEVRPNAIVCTQAFPCGMIADYKKSYGLDIPLFGVLTDYAPHSYWVYNNVDSYVVPSEETGRTLIDNGIDPHRVKPFGIPIDAKFQSVHGREEACSQAGIDPARPCVLIMGGTQGLGPMQQLVRSIESSDLDIQAIVVTGTNKKLYRWLARRRYRKNIIVKAYAEDIERLMAASTVIMTKPGGITTAEALATGLPMLIVSPLPGQEAMNTKFLLKEGVAVKAENPDDAILLLEELLYNNDKLKAMSAKAAALSRPDSAVRIANLVLEAIGRC